MERTVRRAGSSQASEGALNPFWICGSKPTRVPNTDFPSLLLQSFSTWMGFDGL